MDKKNRYTTELSPFFYEFVRWIGNSSKETGVSKVYFFTREGEFFKTIYDTVRLTDSETDWPEAEILEVSRISTFAPSLSDITTKELMRMWSQYETQSVETLLISLGMNPEDFKSDIEKYQLADAGRIKKPWQDERVIAFMKDAEIQHKLETCIWKQRAQLYQYFEEKGLYSTAEGTIAVVDIGWRGTIQDNICRLFPKLKLMGYYLCLAPFLNKQSENSEKRGYLEGKESRILLKYSAPIEMLCNSSGGSVAGYENGKAIRLKDSREDQVYERFTKGVQSQILTGVKMLSKQNQLGNVNKKTFDNILLFPEKNMAKAFFSLRHNETFGNGVFVNKNKSITKTLFVKACLNHEARARLKKELWETTWPQGYLLQNHMSLAMYLYNYILERKYLS